MMVYVFFNMRGFAPNACLLPFYRPCPSAASAHRKHRCACSNHMCRTGPTGPTSPTKRSFFCRRLRTARQRVPRTPVCRPCRALMFAPAGYGGLRMFTDVYGGVPRHIVPHTTVCNRFTAYVCFPRQRTANIGARAPTTCVGQVRQVRQVRQNGRFSVGGFVLRASVPRPAPHAGLAPRIAANTLPRPSTVNRQPSTLNPYRIFFVLSRSSSTSSSSVVRGRQ